MPETGHGSIYAEERREAHFASIIAALERAPTERFVSGRGPVVAADVDPVRLTIVPPLED